MNPVPETLTDEQRRVASMAAKIAAKLATIADVLVRPGSVTAEEAANFDKHGMTAIIGIGGKNYEVSIRPAETMEVSAETMKRVN